LFEPITITELNSQIKELLETNFSFVYVIGEISNFKKHIPSGHFYFLLKDSDSQISSIMWKSRNIYLNFTPEDGMKVLVKGRVTLYSSQGKYQIDVFDISKLGIGDLQIQFEKLKEKLRKEGLFDEKYKIPIEEFPEYPNKVGIITSETGAVINDFQKIAAKRFPLAQIYLFPVNVQGAGASEEICKAINYANNPELGLEIIVIARGGGSAEDLFTFNEEKIARAVFNSKIPVVSAIGHEVDFTICDFVADVRAATPSEAAEIIFPDSIEIEKDLDEAGNNLRYCLSDRIKLLNSNLDFISNNFHFNKPLNILNEYKMRLDDNQKTLENKKDKKLSNIKYTLSNLENLLMNISPEKTLKRGYTYVLKKGKLVKRKKELDSGDLININFYDGSEKAIIN
jgi:exodeoxyribonuclease VII large subunit